MVFTALSVSELLLDICNQVIDGCDVVIHLIILRSNQNASDLVQNDFLGVQIDLFKPLETVLL